MWTQSPSFSSLGRAPRTVAMTSPCLRPLAYIIRERRFESDPPPAQRRWSESRGRGRRGDDSRRSSACAHRIRRDVGGSDAGSRRPARSLRPHGRRPSGRGRPDREPRAPSIGRTRRSEPQPRLHALMADHAALLQLQAGVEQPAPERRRVGPLLVALGDQREELVQDLLVRSLGGSP